MANILFINNDGAGFADKLPVEANATAEDVFLDQMGSDADPKDYSIRVNREVVDPDTVLRDGDIMSVVPGKIEGA